MKNKKTTFASLLAMALVPCVLVSCAATPPAGGSVRGGKPPKYTAPQQTQYNEWWIEPATCTVRARASDFSLSTDGRPRNGVITVRALFDMPLAGPPTPEISEILAPVPVEGSRRGYSIILAYDANNAAHMLKPDTYLIVRYQPLIGSQVLESSFGTHGLMFALSDLAKACNS